MDDMKDLISAIHDQTDAIQSLVDSNALFLQALVQAFDDEKEDREQGAAYLEETGL
jgi:hypothetical protein